MKAFVKSWKLKSALAGLLWGAPQASLALSNLSVTADKTNLYYSYNYVGNPTFLHVFLDTNKNKSNGYSVGGLGAEYMIENETLYKFSGSSTTTWNWTAVGSSNRVKSGSKVSFSVLRTSVGQPTGLNVFVNTSAGESSAIVAQSLLNSSTPPPVVVVPPVTAPPVVSTKSVAFAANDAFISNPERGFFMTTDCRANPVSAGQLLNYKSQYGQTVFNCLFYLREFKSAPLTNAVLEQLQTQMNEMRTAGFKMILRIAYTNTDIDDAPLAVVKGHLDQLAPLFKNNVDVIATVQAGIIGQWAEMSTSTNYGGANGPFTATDWANRKAVIDKLLQVIPASRMVAVRTPEFKMQPYGNTPLSDSEAFTGTARARVSHYNDCFLSSSNDYGTYRGSADKDFVKQDSKYLAMSGETCAPVVQNDCANAVSEMGALHWSLLHEGYNINVIKKWKAQGCFDTIQARLGYRLQLQSATLPTTAKAGATVPLVINILNTGFAALYNARPVQLILRHTSSGAIVRVPLNADPRRWLPGSTINMNQSITLPTNLPEGSYAMLLALPDASSSIASRPEYSIQLANTGIWEAATGFNNLKVNLVVSK